MKTMKQSLAAVLAVIMLLAACGTAAAEQEARRMDTAADAEEWVATLLGDHPEELDTGWLTTQQLKDALAPAGGMAGFAIQAKALGAPEKIGPATEGKLQGYITFSVPCAFPVNPLDLILVVQDGAIAGIQFGAYTGGNEEAGQASAAYDSIELALPVPSLGELPGTLTVPKGEGPFPAVILLQGSGSSDRDETIGSLKPFRDIAEGLTEQGVAVYRFDKRSYVYGVELAGNKQITLADEYLEDAVNAVQLVSKQERIDPDRIFVLGHSLGGNAIPAIARELEKAPVKARGFIMLAASPRPLDVLVREQYEFLYSLLPEITEEQQAEKDVVFAELDKLKDMDALTEDDTVMGVYASYWKWLAAYDILQAADEISRPVLLLQGEEDYQVTMTDFGLWKEAVGGKDNWQLKSYPGLTHLFTEGKKAEGSAAYSGDKKTDARVILDIAEFVNGIK